MKKNKNYLAIDLGTTMGWAVKKGDTQKIYSGTVSFKEKTRLCGAGLRFYEFRNWLDLVISRLDGLECVYSEAVVAHSATQAAQIYGGFAATLQVWCADNEVPLKGFPVGTIKKNFTGRGNANKKDMMAEAVRRGYNPSTDNAADAIAILCTANVAE